MLQVFRSSFFKACSTGVFFFLLLSFTAFAGGSGAGGEGGGYEGGGHMGPGRGPNQQGSFDDTGGYHADVGGNAFGGVSSGSGLGVTAPTNTVVPVVVPKKVVVPVTTTLPPNVILTPTAKANYAKMDPKAQAMLASIASKVSFNITVNSTHRSHSHNAAVNGAKKSQHTNGLAVDISTAGLTSAQKSELGKAIASTPGVNGWGFYSNSVHADARQTTAKAAWGPNFSRTSLDEGLAHQPEMADSYAGWASTPASSVSMSVSQSADPTAAVNPSRFAPDISTDPGTLSPTSPVGTMAAPEGGSDVDSVAADNSGIGNSTDSRDRGGVPSFIPFGSNQNTIQDEKAGNYQRSVACNIPVLDRLMRSSCETALVRAHRVESAETNLMDPHPEADDDEYVEVTVDLKNGLQRSFVVPVLASGEERLAAAQSAGINIEDEEVFAQIFGIPLENSTYDMKNVTEITHEEHDGGADVEQYRVYNVELENGTVHRVRVDHDSTDEEIEIAFHSTGYVGSIDELLAISHAETDIAFLSRMIDELKRLVDELIKVITNEEDTEDSYTNLQDLPPNMRNDETDTSPIEVPSPQDTNEHATSTIACTAEAKICADGSSVGRVPPTCEFAACPLPTDTNEIRFEIKVTDASGNIVTNWGAHDSLTLQQGEELDLRWEAGTYSRCLPFIADNGTYSFSGGGDIKMTSGNTEAEGFDVTERTGTYRIECDGQLNGEADVDERIVEVTVE